MGRHVSIQRVQVWIIQIGFNHPAFQAINDKNLTHPAPKSAHFYVRGDKTLLVLPPYKLYVFIPAPGQSANKGIDHAIASRLRIVEHPYFPIVNLGLQARGSLMRSEEHTSELQSRGHLVCRLLLE